MKQFFCSRWRSVRLASLFHENTVKNEDFLLSNALQFRYGSIVQKKKFDLTSDLIETYKKYTLIQPGDIMINGLNLNYDFITQRVALVPSTGIITSAYICLRPRNSVNYRFYTYYLKALDVLKVFNGLGTGIRLTLSYDSIKNMVLPLPPREEQDQIVRYLDWQVSKINRLIAAKRKEIALLHEQHKRRISEAVLHGNDDGCCQKDSGVEWIGMIPEHWSVIRCKYVFTERDERSIAGEEEHLSMSQKYGLVPDSKLDERRMLSESYVGGKVCYKNDLILNRLKAHLGVFALSPQKGVISPDYTVLIPNAERILPTYGEAVLKNDLCRRELRIRVRGIIEGFWRLYTDDFNTIVIPLPPLKEQEQIMKHLSALNNKFTALKQRLEQEINILHELRTRLISDVVTGQVDVRGIKVPDDEYINNEITEEEFEEESENNEEE